jgi:hypothetical protein
MNVFGMKANTYVIFRWLAGFVCAAGIGLLPMVASCAAQPLTDPERVDLCTRNFCGPLTGRAGGGQFSCDIAKSWTKEELASSGFAKKISWSPGDVRCAAKFSVSREALAKAVKEKTYTLRLGKCPVNCEVRNGSGGYTVNLTLDPEAQFKDGKPVKVALGVGDIEAPAAVKGVLWSAAKLDRYIGLFDAELIARLNKFIDEDCPGHPSKED